MLLANEIYRSFGAEKVLAGLSFNLEPGELVGLIGASGSGKTVFARILVGLESWERGSLRVDDRQISEVLPVDAPEWKDIRQRVGLVAQNRGAPTYRRLGDWITEGLTAVQGLSPMEAEELALPWIRRFGLEGHEKKFTVEVSGGQLARACLARAMVLSPRYLICDEITSALDPSAAAIVASSLRDVAAAGVGVLMISHQLEFLRRHASRVDFLYAGGIAVSGPAQRILTAPEQPELRTFVEGVKGGR